MTHHNETPVVEQRHRGAAEQDFQAGFDAGFNAARGHSTKDHNAAWASYARLQHSGKVAMGYSGGYEWYRNKWIGDHEEMIADLVREFVPRSAAPPSGQVGKEEDFATIWNAYADKAAWPDRIEPSWFGDLRDRLADSLLPRPPGQVGTQEVERRAMALITYITGLPSDLRWDKPFTRYVSEEADKIAALTPNGENRASHDGYVAAFYHLGKLLGIDSARTGSPSQVWQNEMLPKLTAMLRGDGENAGAAGEIDPRLREWLDKPGYGYVHDADTMRGMIFAALRPEAETRGAMELPTRAEIEAVFAEPVVGQAGRLGISPQTGQSPGDWMMSVRKAALLALLNTQREQGK